MRWSGYRTCLLPQTPCRPVGTDNTNSGRTYIGLISIGGVGSYATSRCGHQRPKPGRPIDVCWGEALRNRKDDPPKTGEKSSLGLWGLSRIPRGNWRMIYPEFSVLFLLSRSTATRAQYGHFAEAALALRAVGVLDTHLTLVLAGHHVVAKSQQSAVRQRYGARQTAVVDERTIGGIQIGDADLVACHIDAAMGPRN